MGAGALRDSGAGRLEPFDSASQSETWEDLPAGDAALLCSVVVLRPDLRRPASDLEAYRTAQQQSGTAIAKILPQPRAA